MARAALLLVLLCVPVSANPVLETLINEFQVAPDSLERVELHPIDWMSLPFDLSGCRLVTSAGTAIIDTGIVIESESSFVVLGRANVTGPFGLADDSGPIVLLEDGNSWPLDSVFYAGSRTDWPWTPPPGTSSGLHTWMEYYPEPTRCFVWYIDSTPTFGSTNDDTASAIRGRILDPNSIPVPGAYVRISSSVGGRTTMSALWPSPGGQFEFRCTGPGVFWVTAWKNGYMPGFYPESVRVGVNQVRGGIDVYLVPLAVAEERAGGASAACIRWQSGRLVLTTDRAATGVLTVNDIAGRILYRSAVAVKAGENRIALPALHAGVLIAEFRAGPASVRGKFVAY